MSIKEFSRTVNEFASRGVPFLFMVDFEIEKPLVFPLAELPDHLLYDVQGRTNASAMQSSPSPIRLSKEPLAFSTYRRKFEEVRCGLVRGDSFLVNLTIKTPITTNLTLRQLFNVSKARYKLLFGNEFLVFSPETFVRIEEGKIWSYPMKGTIDAAVENAKEAILNDEKERAEHVTIVDLIRNDLSAVADDVVVTRFRYVDRLRTMDKDLFQVSSEICGSLPADYHRHLGDILISLLPAGSVSGAPKPKTLQIIRAAEEEPRGYYTGVFGLFDGGNLVRAVMIRYIEQIDGVYYYRSGGGITSQSDPQKEYQEAIDKVYVPID